MFQLYTRLINIAQMVDRDYTFIILQKWRNNAVRLDKYLKLSKLVKRRTIAQEMIEIGAVRVNKKNSKPSTEVKEGDVLEIAYPRRIISVKVLVSDETLLKRNSTAYDLIEEKRADQEERPW